ncbi:copper homeostasis protein CutC-like isoform X1 [Penaeus japonicus]|uniref:copper homeostasis protein CutC-like isoform X1 n=2 Tax=Penaeus japonicus TaxID=27405 RepID=UPI001C714905|nr:copper homeostasis protein CutC-like isoform X1 [Penaeus japonicus]
MSASSVMLPQLMANRKFEVCVDSVESALAAVVGGADRLELCMALTEGGLTPTTGLLHTVKKYMKKPTEVYCMVRPRPGPMVFSREESEVIFQDAHTLKKAGADGLVFGALTRQGTIDYDLCKTFRMAAGEIPCTFHRAFDLLKDPLSSLETVIELGYQRILTSGGKATAVEGADVIAQLVTAAKGRIGIIAAAGIKSSNIANIITHTGVTECHASARVCRMFGAENSKGAKVGHGSDNMVWVTCSKEVQSIKRSMEYN